MSTSSSQSSSSYENAYGYNPSLATGVTFIVLFFLSSCTHLFQAIRYKTTWQALFVVGAGAKCLGWIARTAAAVNPDSTELFTMQIALLVFAPAWTMAGVYIILFRMTSILGKETCPLPAKTSLWTCLGVDFVSLVLQATGGGIAGEAFSGATNTQPGTYTMVAGILFQLASTVTYSILMAIVFVHGFKGIKSSAPLSRLAFAMVLTTACMIARRIYRSIELLQGWQGYLNTHEQYVIGLDGALMVTAVIALNNFNPGMLLSQAEAKKGVREVGEASSREKVIRQSSMDSEMV